MVSFLTGERKYKHLFPSHGRQVGLIAQEVEEVLPEAVGKSPDGYKTVDYEKLVPVLVEAIKEQQKQIDELRSLLCEQTLAAE